ncbi:HlyD family secretion protein [Roseibium aestuarii]|uniref:HlyD family efflux transporter periplasmic adaptor subunit n=1 Tax=Roseibium aestuarii TaxID=2600299 RepID=A0ABW4JQU6_9HYPH|nr:HlyD family secretion protein [Roseibium aestuarii]
MAEETANPSDASTGAAPVAPKKKKGKGRIVLAVILLAGVSAGAYEGHAWWTHGRFMETTDDAYVSADITTVLSKVSGYVAEVSGADNRMVKAGDVLIRIDDGDYKLAVQQARNSLSSAEATVERIGDQISAAEVSVTQAEAALRAAESAHEEARLTFDRQTRLTSSNVTSQATLDTARTGLQSAKANEDQARAAVSLAKANVDVLRGQQKEATQAVATARTALEKAERDLEFTVVRAPVDGIVGNRAAQIGSFLQAGSRVAAIVPIQDAHIDANFKETQLDEIRQGAEVDIAIDAYPDAKLHGRVESISPATGSVFSLLPSENATGNFTKVVQRVPVKITVDPADVERYPLRAGMSVIVEVDKRTGETREGDGAEVALRN